MNKKALSEICIIITVLSIFLVPVKVKAVTLHYPGSVVSSSNVNNPNNILLDDGNSVTFITGVSYVVVDMGILEHVKQIRFDSYAPVSNKYCEIWLSNDLSNWVLAGKSWQPAHEDTDQFILWDSDNPDYGYYRYIKIYWSSSTSKYCDYIAYETDSDYTYDDGTYLYAYSVAYFKYDTSKLDDQRPTNALANVTVNQQFYHYARLKSNNSDAQKYLTLDFGNVYAVSSLAINLRQPISSEHSSYYVSVDNASWIWIGNLDGIYVSEVSGWKNYSFSETSVRYVKITASDSAGNSIYVYSVRIPKSAPLTGNDIVEHLSLDVEVSLAGGAGNPVEHLSLSVSVSLGEGEGNPVEHLSLVLDDLSIGLSYEIEWYWIPEDDPKLTLTNYTYICNVTYLNVPQEAHIIIMFSGSIVTEKDSDEIGNFTFWASVSSSGNYVWSFAIYQEGVWKSTVFKETYYRQKEGEGSPGGGETGGEWIPTPSPNLGDWIPLFGYAPLLLVIALFVWFGYKIKADKYGAVGGLVAGLFLCVNFGDLPIYLLFFMILSAILLVVYKLHKPQGGEPE